MANLLLMGKTQQRLVREGGLDIDAKNLPPRWGGEVMDYNSPSHCCSSGNNSPTGSALARITDLYDHRIFNPVNSAFGQFQNRAGKKSTPPWRACPAKLMDRTIIVETHNRLLKLQIWNRSPWTAQREIIMAILRRLARHLSAFFIFILLTVHVAWGAEIWVSPAVDPADTAVGDWAATNSTRAHFSFAVPDDFSGFVSAKVVMIGKNDKDTTADVFLSISQNALRYDDFTDALFSLPLSLKSSELIEVDVSSVFPALNAGSDYASLYFESKFAHIVGLRLEYNSILADGDITAVDTPPDGGLAGGTQNGAASLALQESFKLPQTCAAGQFTWWDGTNWVCAASPAPQALWQFEYINVPIPTVFGAEVAALTLDTPGWWMDSFDIGFVNPDTVPRSVACMSEPFGACFSCWLHGVTIPPGGNAMLHITEPGFVAPGGSATHSINCQAGDGTAGVSVTAYQVVKHAIAVDFPTGAIQGPMSERKLPLTPSTDTAE